MNLDEILNSFLTGEPLHDSITIGILFSIFFEFYRVMFSSVFTIFRRN